MKKRRNLNEIENLPRLNPVAKHAFQFNKAQVFTDKKHYRRNAKHSKQEAFVNIGAHVFTKVSWLFVFSFPRAAWECGFGALRHEARNSPQRG